MWSAAAKGVVAQWLALHAHFDKCCNAQKAAPEPRLCTRHMMDTASCAYPTPLHLGQGCAAPGGRAVHTDAVYKGGLHPVLHTSARACIITTGMTPTDTGRRTCCHVTIGARARKASLRRAQHPRLRGAGHLLPPRRDGGSPPRGRGAVPHVTAAPAASGASVSSSSGPRRTPHHCWVGIAMALVELFVAFLTTSVLQTMEGRSATTVT